MGRGGPPLSNRSFAIFLPPRNPLNTRPPRSRSSSQVSSGAATPMSTTREASLSGLQRRGRPERDAVVTHHFVPPKESSGRGGGGPAENRGRIPPAAGTTKRPPAGVGRGAGGSFRFEPGTRSSRGATLPSRGESLSRENRIQGYAFSENGSEIIHDSRPSSVVSSRAQSPSSSRPQSRAQSPAENHDPHGARPTHATVVDHLRTHCVFQTLFTTGIALIR